MMEDSDEVVPLVPIADVVAAFRERPAVPRVVAGLVVSGLLLRVGVALAVGSAAENLIAGLLAAMGLVPLALLWVGGLLQRVGPDDLRTAARYWTWGEAAVAGTVPHVVVVVWMVLGTLLSARF